MHFRLLHIIFTLLKYFTHSEIFWPYVGQCYHVGCIEDCTLTGDSIDSIDSSGEDSH